MLQLLLVAALAAPASPLAAVYNEFDDRTIVGYLIEKVPLERGSGHLELSIRFICAGRDIYRPGSVQVVLEHSGGFRHFTRNDIAIFIVGDERVRWAPSHFGVERLPLGAFIETIAFEEDTGAVRNLLAARIRVRIGEIVISFAEPRLRKELDQLVEFLDGLPER